MKYFSFSSITEIAICILEKVLLFPSGHSVRQFKRQQLKCNELYMCVTFLVYHWPMQGSVCQT